MTHKTQLPTLDALKDQAKRLRKTLAEDGTDISHSRALEMIARQHGYHDWNTIHAAVGNRPPQPVLAVGLQVMGRYLGQDFTGEVIGLSQLPGEGRYRVTLDLDEPVDVVTFDSFSSFRRRITGTIGKDFRTAEKTSNGKPHLELLL